MFVILTCTSSTTSLFHVNDEFHCFAISVSLKNNGITNFGTIISVWLLIVCDFMLRPLASSEM